MSDIVERLISSSTNYGEEADLIDDTTVEITRLRAENEKLKSRILELEMFEQFAGEDNGTIERLREALKDCVADLEVEINTRYHDCNGKVHPALQRKYDNDMSTVRAAAAAIRESGDE